MHNFPIQFYNLPKTSNISGFAQIYANCIKNIWLSDRNLHVDSLNDQWNPILNIKGVRNV